MKPDPIETREIEVVVESLGGLGDGIASLDGKPVFIPKSCPGDRLLVRIDSENQNGFHGTIVQVLTPGKDRVEPPCRYFHQCGGCTLQQLAPDYYRDFKTKMLHLALAQANCSHNAEVIFLPPSSRRRVEFKVAHTGTKPVLAFFGLRSHTPVMIDECIILTPQLQAMIAPINAALQDWPFASRLYSTSLIFADSGIDIVLMFKENVGALPQLDMWCRDLGVARISVRWRESWPQIKSQIAPVEMRLGNFRIPFLPDAFLQATREGQEILTRFVMEATKSAYSVVDLFCGIGIYSFPLSTRVPVHAVELDAQMVASMRAVIKQNTVANFTVEQRDLFKQPIADKELKRFDAVVVNPPRVGANAQIKQIAQSPIPTVVMISCNPATFARDAKILTAAGFRLAKAQGIDQFVWSPHLEIAAVFER